MPVYIHLSNIVVDKKAVQTLCHGGLQRFRKQWLHGHDPLFRTEDDDLFSIAAMNDDEHDIGILQSIGLSFDYDTGVSPHFTIIQRYGGMAWAVDWLEHNASFAWHVSCDPFLRQKAIDFDNRMMSDILAECEAGGNPFMTMRSW